MELLQQTDSNPVLGPGQNISPSARGAKQLIQPPFAIYMIKRKDFDTDEPLLIDHFKMEVLRSEPKVLDSEPSSTH